MKHLGAFVGAVVMGLLVGCGPVGPEELGGEESTGEGVEVPGLSPEQLQELQSRVPVADEGMVQAFAEACQPSNSGGCVAAGYSACTNWSAYYDCGELSACNVLGCRTRWCDVDGCYVEYSGSETQGRNRYRVCFNPAGASCTEYERTNTIYCGCGEL